MNLGPAPGTVYRDTVTTTVDIRLGLLDRLRVLWHGRMTLTVSSDIENVTGHVRGHPAFVYVPRLLTRLLPEHGEAWEAPAEAPGVHDRIKAAMDKRGRT